MVWIVAEEGRWLCWTKDVEDGAARREEERKTSEEVRGCSEGGHRGLE